MNHNKIVQNFKFFKIWIVDLTSWPVKRILIFFFKSNSYQAFTLHLIHYTVPYGYPYEVSSEIEVGNYRIPEGDLLLLNYRSCHMDYTYWKRPAEFRPENFTDSDGDLIHHEAFLPYGLGEWFSCMGIIVANQH